MKLIECPVAFFESPLAISRHRPGHFEFPSSEQAVHHGPNAVPILAPDVGFPIHDEAVHILS